MRRALPWIGWIAAGVAIASLACAQVLNVNGHSLNTGSGSLTAITAAQDWTNRSTGSGVIWATRFTQDSDVSNWRYTNGTGWDPTPTPGSVGSYVRFNSSCGIIGDGCLELEQLTNGNMASVWWRPFDAAQTHYVSSAPAGDHYAGQGFYIQFRFMTNATGVSGNPSPLNGKKIESAMRTEFSCCNQEMVVADLEYRTLFQMYQGVGQTQGPPPTGYEAINSILPAPDYFGLEPNGTLPGGPCSYGKDAMGDKSGCWRIDNNVWYTFLVYILPATESTSDGRVTVYGWKPGQTGYSLIMDYPNLWMTYEPGYPAAFNAIILWIYETGRTSGPANQKQWYDQVILSSQFIACPVT